MSMSSPSHWRKLILLAVTMNSFWVKLTALPCRQFDVDTITKKDVHYPNERAELLNGIDPYDLLNSNDDLVDSISDILEEEGDDNNNKWLEIPAEVYGFTVSSSCKIVILVKCGCCLMD